MLIKALEILNKYYSSLIRNKYRPNLVEARYNSFSGDTSNRTEKKHSEGIHNSNSKC